MFRHGFKKGFRQWPLYCVATAGIGFLLAGVVLVVLETIYWSDPSPWHPLTVEAILLQAGLSHAPFSSVIFQRAFTTLLGLPLSMVLIIIGLALFGYALKLISKMNGKDEFLPN